MLDKFPNYELQSKEGSEAAIRDIESKLSGVTLLSESVMSPPNDRVVG